MKLLALFAVICTGFSASAQMPGWQHNQPITVSEHSGAEVYNYQLRLSVNTAALVSAGEMLSTGADIRFTSSCTGGDSFNYWIESGMNTASTIIWVKIDTLHANSGRTIYMHYGNAIASSLSAIAGTFSGPNSATDSVSNTNLSGSADAQRGFRFAPTEDLLVTAFGKFEPTGTTRTITIFDFATQAVLAQSGVAGPAATYSYGTIPLPLWLTGGTQYLAEIFQPSGADAYYFGAAPQVGQHLTYFDMRYCNGCTASTFPTNVVGGMHYGYVDFWYFTKNNVSPAPTYTLGAFALSLADDVNVCSQDSIALPLAAALGGEAPFTYAWTGAGLNDPSVQMPLASPATAAEYFVSVTDNCGNVETDSITVNVLALPSAEITVDFALICNGETAVLSVPGTDTYVWDDNSTGSTLEVSPSVTTTYGVVATAANGCTAESEFTVNVNVPLTATHQVSICDGDSYSIGSSNYAVSGTYVDTLAGVTSCDSIVTTQLTVMPLPQGAQSVSICFGSSYSIGTYTYSASGIYTDTIPGSAGGCDIVFTTDLTILPAVNTTVQASGITLTAPAGADGYQWINCASSQFITGATSSVFEPTANGSYAVIVTEGDCSATSACTAITTVGMEDLDLIENVSVFPNPNKGTFTVQSSMDQLLIVTDAAGKIVSRIEVKAGEAQQVQLENSRAGMYFVKSRTKVIRLVVE